MDLFFDSGATKCDCIVLEQGKYVRHFTNQGINASYASNEMIDNVLLRFAKAVDSEVERIVFSGAGCGNPQNGERVKERLSQHFHAGDIVVESDLAGACRLLTPGEAGMVAILGTGAAVCLYDGNSIVEQVPSLGWMLGDEGSGTHLGKKFITSYLKNELLPETAIAFEQEYAVDRTDVIRKIYRTPSPNLFFSSVAKFMAANADADTQLKSIIQEAFEEFFTQQISKIYQYSQFRLHIMGSVGLHFQNYIQKTMSKHGVTIGRIAGAPLEIFKGNQ